MVWFIMFLVFALAALIYFFVAPKFEFYRWPALIPLSLALLLLLFSITTTVGTRATGVPTVFNKPTGATLDAGLHLKAPWASVTDIDSSVQSENFSEDRALRVKIGDGGTAAAWTSVRWRINPDKADVVFQDYRNTESDINDAVRSAIFFPNITGATNETFGNYDPLSESSAQLAKPDLTPEELSKITINVNPDYTKFSDDIKKLAQEKIDAEGSLIEIISVNVTFLALPDQTQKRIDRFNASVQDTKIAAQQVATQEQQANANDKLAASLQDPNVLVSKCFDGLIAGDFANQPGFSCWSGGGGSVVIPGTTR